jgi:hypothetical protein
MLYLDSNIVIYVVEQHAVFGPKALQRLAAAQAAGLDCRSAIWPEWSVSSVP